MSAELDGAGVFGLQGGLGPAPQPVETGRRPEGRRQARRPAPQKPAGLGAFGVPVVALLLAFPAAAGDGKDPILLAMEDELARSRMLRTMALAQPYYFEYAIHDGVRLDVSATLGALSFSRKVRFRVPRITVRAGDPDFDNTNYGGGDYRAGSAYDVSEFPLDDSYTVLRHHLWLATDMAYKSALELYSLKKAALRDVTESEEIPDFSPAPPLERITRERIHSFDEAAWTGRVRRLSAIFASYPVVRSSAVSFDGEQGLFYLATSEGTRVRVPEDSSVVQVRATAQAPDGMLLHAGLAFHSLAPDRLPSDAKLERAVKEVADDLTALAEAPVGDSYAGPVLFEGMASPQLFAQILGGNLAAPRRPVTPPGRPQPQLGSELENRVGTRILPEWMDVVDDPTQSEWQGRTLFGHYDVDLEGVAAQRVPVVDKGVLKSFLLTRQPMKGFRTSNGHARLPGVGGAKAAGIGNLFVHANESVPAAALRQHLIELCKQRGKPYGIVIRRMDFPTTGAIAEVRRLLASAVRSGGARPVSAPLLVYRVYLDGREQLVRGVALRGLNARSMKDILAASTEETAFDFYDTGAPLGVGGGSASSESTVVAPSVLLDDVEMERAEQELPKPPLVPAPSAVQ